MMSMKIIQFSRTTLPPSRLACPATSKIFPSPWPCTANFKRPLPHSQIITNQLKEKIIQGWLLYGIRSFLQVGLRFQYQFINLVWLSVDFFSFSWSQSRTQSNFEKSFQNCFWKSNFSPSSYSEETRWGYLVVITTAQLHSTKPELRSCACSNTARGV